MAMPTHKSAVGFGARVIVGGGGRGGGSDKKCLLAMIQKAAPALDVFVSVLATIVQSGMTARAKRNVLLYTAKGHSAI